MNPFPDNVDLPSSDGLIHRDDLPPDVLESLEAQYPGRKIVCAGDRPDLLPASVREAAEKLLHRMHSSLKNGTCCDCGAVMPNWPPQEGEWKAAPGWVLFCHIATEEPQGLQCPACDAAEGEGHSFIDLSKLED